MSIALCVVFIVLLIVRHYTSKAVAKEEIISAGKIDTEGTVKAIRAMQQAQLMQQAIEMQQVTQQQLNR